MGELLRDLRYGLRGLARNPGFAAVAVVTLTLGIGATTSVLTVVDAVVLRPLPYPDPERLVRLYSTDAQRPDDRDNTSPTNFLDWKAGNTSFEGIAGFAGRSVNLVDLDDAGGEPGQSHTSYSGTDSRTSCMATVPGAPAIAPAPACSTTNWRLFPSRRAVPGR